MKILTAYFIAPADGEYTFCTSSRNASFLEIDGELVVANGGRHAPQTNVAKQGDIVKVFAAVNRMAGIGEEDVQAAVAGFRSRKTRGADSGVPPEAS